MWKEKNEWKKLRKRREKTNNDKEQQYTAV